MIQNTLRKLAKLFAPLDNLFSFIVESFNIDYSNELAIVKANVRHDIRRKLRDEK